MKEYKIGIDEIQVEAEGLEDLEKKLRSMDLFKKLKIIRERQLECLDCGGSVELGKCRCDPCFNIWLNRRTSTLNYCRNN